MKHFFKIFTILLIILPFLINQYSIFRVISVILGIIFFIINHRQKKLRCVLWTILMLIILYSGDLIIVEYLQRIPVFSFKITSNEHLETYNSFFYRIYNCDNFLVLDNFYQKDYMCEIDIKETDINSFLANITDNFKDYKNKFVNINGKVSSIVGNQNIKMQSYEIGENTLNGEVNFSDNIILNITSNKGFDNLENLKIYDIINVVGRISNIKEEGNSKVINMVDAKIVSQSDFNSFSINVVSSKNCESDLKLLSKTDDLIYYSSCIDSIYAIYNDDNKYDLGYVLTDKRMTLDLLNKDIKSQSNDLVELYEHKDFNVIKCKNNKNVIVGNKSLSLDNNYCEISENLSSATQEGV